MAVFPGMNSKIKDAVTKLEEQLVRNRIYFGFYLSELLTDILQAQYKDQASPEEITKANEAITAGQNVVKESS